MKPSNLIKFFKILFVFIVILNLAACGFKVRNQNDLPTEMHTLYVESSNPYSQFVTLLKQSLIASGVTLVDAPKKSPVTLTILSTNLSNTYYSVGPSSVTRVYTIFYSVNFALKDAKGNTILPNQTVSNYRTLTLQANQLLQNNNQLNLLKQDMQRDAIEQIYDRLTSTQVFELLHNHETKLSTTRNASK